MDILEIIKALTGEKENDLLFNYWIDKSIIKINKYLNKEHTKEQATTLYADAIIQSVVNEYQEQKQKGVKAMSQGQRSVTYKDDAELDQAIKKLLPPPYMRLK